MKHIVTIPGGVHIEIEGHDLVEMADNEMRLTDEGVDALRAELEHALSDHIVPGSVVVDPAGSFRASMRGNIGTITVRGTIEV